jgi:hypothetical protein
MGPSRASARAPELAGGDGGFAAVTPSFQALPGAGILHERDAVEVR